MTEKTEPSTQVVSRKARVYKVQQFLDYEQLRKDQGYSLNDLSNAMQTQSGLFSHYGIIASRASLQVDTFKMLLESVEAKIYRKIRDAAIANGEKPTVDQLKAEVALNEAVRNVKYGLNEAKQIEAAAKTAVESFRHRRDMLVQEGLISREEMKGELKIAERNARDTEMTMMKSRFLSRKNPEGATE